MPRQQNVYESIIEALLALQRTDASQSEVLIAGLTTTADLLQQINDRLEIAVALITAHEDNHHSG